MKILLFHADKKILDKAIKFFTRDDFRHAGVIFPEFTGGQDVIAEASGFKGKALKHRHLGDIKNSTITQITILNTPQECFVKSEKMIGKSYDWLGFFGYPLNRQNPKYLYCFEFVLNVIQQIPEIKPLVKLVKDGSVSGNDILRILQHESLNDRVKIETKIYGSNGLTEQIT